MKIIEKNVQAVLLADGWHRVNDESFSIIPFGFEIDEGAGSVFTGSDVDTRLAGADVVGFVFQETVRLPAYDEADREEVWTSGPLSSIIAVRERY